MQPLGTYVAAWDLVSVFFWELRRQSNSMLHLVIATHSVTLHSAQFQCGRLDTAKRCALKAFPDMSWKCFFENAASSLLIKIEIQISFRSVQKRPRTPQDARGLPTWSRHGANMRSRRSAKIGPSGLENLVPRGSEARIVMKSENRPHTNTKWTPSDLKIHP